MPYGSGIEEQPLNNKSYKLVAKHIINNLELK